MNCLRLVAQALPDLKLTHDNWSLLPLGLALAGVVSFLVWVANRREDKVNPDAQVLLRARTQLRNVRVEDLEDAHLRVIYVPSQEAERLLKSGQSWQAEQLLHEHRRKLGAAQGLDSPAYAAALNMEALFLHALGDEERSLPLLREAAAIPATRPGSQAQRLVILNNLAFLLLQNIQAEEAVPVLEEALALKKELAPGEDPHAGHEFRALLAARYYAGDPETAFGMVEQAILARSGQPGPELADLLALRAFIQKSRDAPDEELFAHLDVVEAHKLEPMLCQECGGYALMLPPLLALSVLSVLRQYLLDKPDQADSLKFVLRFASICAGREKDYALRHAILEELVQLSADNVEERTLALVEQANNLDDAQRPAECQEKFEEARQSAQAPKATLELRARVECRYGWWLMQVGQNANAETHFQPALEAAQGTTEPLARASVAEIYGEFLHHSRRFEEALPHLRRAAMMLPPLSPERYQARVHRYYAERGEECDCHEGGRHSLTREARRELESKLPAGLIQEVRVVTTNGKLTVEPTFVRGLSAPERALADRATGHVRAILQKYVKP